MSNLAKERQIQRLKYIDLCAYVLGYINRKVLMNRFDVKQAWGTKDFNTYQEKAGHNIVYDHSLKAYTPTNWFRPYYEHSVDDAIDLISEGRQSIICEPNFSKKAYSYAIPSVSSELENVAPLLRALTLGKKTEIEYISRSSGKSSRIIAPHSLIKTGCFAYARAFDHQTGEFRSFKLNRVLSSKLIDSVPINNEQKSDDEDWNTELTITIGLNGDVDNQEAIEFDYGLKDGVMTLTVKKALKMYFLMDWNIAPMEMCDLPNKLFPLKVLSISA